MVKTTPKNPRYYMNCRNMTPHSRADMDKIVSWQVHCVDPPGDHTFLWPLSP